MADGTTDYDDGGGGEEEVDGRNYKDELLELQREVDDLRAKNKTLELKKKESDLALNKIKTEINSLRSLDKLWKDASKTIFLNVHDVKQLYDAQIDQMLDGWRTVVKTGERIQKRAANLKQVQQVIRQLQQKIVQQDETIANLNSRIRQLNAEVEDKTRKVERLSQGIEEEVDRLCQPMRDKIAEAMLQVMKEKANRAQERREFADLWPDDRMMPSVLMRYRCVNAEERARRVKTAADKDASLALSLEIRRNVSESQAWEIQYDDYGRPFYQHRKTGQVSEEPPEILAYKPPDGRDELGNVVVSADNDASNWVLQTDARGQVMYKNKTTGELSLNPPFLYESIPPGKSREQTVAESAQVVLDFIREKISKHTIIKKRRKDILENPLTPEEQKKRDKQLKNRTPEEVEASGDHLTEDGEPLELSKYQYDIETVEMLAHELAGGAAGGANNRGDDEDVEEVRKQRRSYLPGTKEIREFKEDLFEGPLLLQMDTAELSISKLRDIVEALAQSEEHLEKKLSRARTNLQDFSFLLQDKVAEENATKLAELTELRLRQERDRRVAEKMMMAEKRKREQAAREAEEKRVADAEAAAKERALAKAKSSKKSSKAKGKDDKEKKKEKKKTKKSKSKESSAENAAEPSDSEVSDSDRENVADTSTAVTILPAIEDEDDVPEEPVELDAPPAPAATEAALEDDLLVQQLPPLPMTTEDVDKQVFGDPCRRLFGEIAEERADNADVVPELLSLCKNVSNFALFCGFNSLSADAYPLQCNSNYSLIVDTTMDPSGATRDDEWLSAHFFLTVTPQQLADHKQRLFHSLSAGAGGGGMVRTGPFDVPVQSFGESSRHLSRGYTPLTRAAKEEAIAVAQFDAWKRTQLFYDIACHQLQQSALQQLVEHRTPAFYDIDRALSTAVTVRQPFVRIRLSELEFKASESFKSVGTTLYFVQASVSDVWSRISTGILESPFQMKWLDVEFEGDIDVNRMQLEDLKVEVLVLEAVPELDEAEVAQMVVGRRRLSSVSSAGSAPPQQRVCGVGSQSLMSLMGANLGRSMPLCVELQRIGAAPKSETGVDAKDAEIEAVESIDKDAEPTAETSAAAPAGPDGAEMVGAATEAPAEVARSPVLGALTFVISATLLHRTESVDADPNDQLLLHKLLPGVDPSVPELHTQTGAPMCERAAAAVEEAAKHYRLLVAELRGDNWTLAQRLEGGLAASTPVPAMAIRDTDLKPLPRFDRSTAFLEKRLLIHRSSTRKLVASIADSAGQLLERFKTRRDKLSKDLADSRQKQRKFSDTVEDVKKDVVRVTKSVVDLRKPNPEPKAPEFGELPPIPYVPMLPTTGTLDSRGKKKKALPPNDMKNVMDTIETGGLDGAEQWPFADAVFPTQAQQVKLAKQRELRNAVLDARHQQELQNRERATEMYQAERARWETAEKRRLYELEKAKKDCRKVNLKYDAAVQRLERFEEETRGLELDIQAINDLTVLQQSSADRFKLIRVKQTLEFERQQAYVEALKQRLLRALNARRVALETPRTAATTLQFEQLRTRSERALAVLKLELLECKQLLVQEGVRLRQLLHEEAHVLKTESMRVQVSLEILQQRSSFDTVLSKYKFDCMNLLNDLERLKLREADKDDEGVDTVDNWGERYVADKSWASNIDVVKCQRLVDLCVAKVQTTEGFSRAAAESQRLLIDVLASQWGESYFSARDSWTELSDVDRAQRVVADTVQYLSLTRRLLADERAANLQPFQHVAAATSVHAQQLETAIDVHTQESLSLRLSARNVIDEVRRHLSEYRSVAQQKIDGLEQSIVQLSRECQKVREEIVAQKLVFEEKTKVLWAFIHTLQTSIQQMSGRMEILVEERDKIVIQAKLMADNTRHQLRVERKHCSNLTFVIHSQRGTIRHLKDVIRKITRDAQRIEREQKHEKFQLRRDVWEHVFVFTRLCTDVDALFEFFASRLANLAGTRANLNDALCRNNAAVVLAALSKNPRPLIRRCAARALGGMGWNGFVEMRILLWDAMMYWKMYKARVLSQEQAEFSSTLQSFSANGKFEAILTMKGEIEEFVPAGNLSLRNLIKQRRQWALRAARRVEGPHRENQRLLNIRDQVLTNLLELSLLDGEVDWEIARNAALAVSIASFEASNHADMVHHESCVARVLQMCGASDAEVNTHAAITIANLTHKDPDAQRVFGERGAVVVLLRMLQHPVADVLEAASAALANLTCYSDANCQALLTAGGVKQVVQVMSSAYSENLLDSDQNDEVQANAAEVLANLSRFSTQESIGHFDGVTIDSLVIMCASSNKPLKRSVSLVLGNIAQQERCRHEIGMRGGVEALLLATEDSDVLVQANALWALTNLMWYPPNQERAGRFTAELVQFITQSEHEAVRVNAAVLLGNVLYYNSTNRVRFLECDGALEALIAIVVRRDHVPMVEAMLRALLSLSYLDSIAMWLGVDGGYVPLLIAFLRPPLFSRESMRYSLEILCNLCLHHANRLLIHDHGGIEAIVPLHADVDAHIRGLSVQIIEHLEDITPPEVLARMRKDVGLERMVALAASHDPLVRAVAAESIGEELWAAAQQPPGALSKQPQSGTAQAYSAHDRAHQLGAVDALLAMLLPESEPVSVVLPALWSLRNLLHGHRGAQQQFGVYRDGIVVVSQVLRRAWLGLYADQVEKVLEAALACLVHAVEGHSVNARRLVLAGLDALLAVAERAPTSDAHLQAALKAEGVQALAQALLVSLGPHNYVVCRNCSRRQDLRGLNCVACGHRLLVDIDEGVLAARKGRAAMLHASHSAAPIAAAAAANTTTSSSSLHPAEWRHGGRAQSPTQRDVALHRLAKQHSLEEAQLRDELQQLQQQQPSVARTAQQQEVREVARALAKQPPVPSTAELLQQTLAARERDRLGLPAKKHTRPQQQQQQQHQQQQQQQEAEEENKAQVRQSASSQSFFSRTLPTRSSTS